MKQIYVVKAAMLSLVWLTASCGLQDIDPDNTEWRLRANPAFSLGSDTVSIIDLIEDLGDGLTEFRDVENEVVTLVFTQGVTFSNSEEIFSLPNQLNSGSISLPATPASPVAFQVPFSESFNFTFEAEGASSIDSIIYRSGTLEYDLTSDIPSDFNYSWVLRDTYDTSTGQELSEGPKDVRYLTFSGATDEFDRDLLGLKSAFTTVGGEITTTFTVDGTFDVPSGTPFAGGDIDMTMTMTNPSIMAVYAQFDNQSIEINPVSFDITEIDDLRGRGLELLDPKLRLTVHNEFGADLLLNFDDVNATYPSGNTETLRFSITDSERLIAAAEDITTGTTSEIEFNADNSNIADLISDIPSSFDIMPSIEVNPSISSLRKNFLTDTSAMRVDATIEVPMVANVEEYLYDLNMNIDEDLSDLDEAEELGLQLVIDNELPVSGSAELILLDSNGDEITRLVDTRTGEEFSFDAPEIGEDNRAVEPMRTVTRVYLDKSEINDLISASSIRVVLTVSSFDPNSDEGAYFYSDARLVVTAGVLGEFDIELEDEQ